MLSMFFIGILFWALYVFLNRCERRYFEKQQWKQMRARQIQMDAAVAQLNASKAYREENEWRRQFK